MSGLPAPTRILLRNDTLSNWESTGKLNKGEVGIAFDSNDNNKVTAKVGTADGQTWSQAKPLSVEPDEIVGVNIENVGRVILEGYDQFDGEDLEFSECIEAFTIDRGVFSNSEFPEWSEVPLILGGAQTKEISVVLSHINILNVGSVGLYGYRTRPEQREYGLVHPSLYNDFKAQTINNTPSYSNSFPVRPIPSEESYLMFLREIEVWELPTVNNDIIEYKGKVDAWVPNKPETYSDGQCPGHCLTQLGYCCYGSSGNGNQTPTLVFDPGQGGGGNGGGGGQNCSFLCACVDGSCPIGSPTGECGSGPPGGGPPQGTGRILSYTVNQGVDISPDTGDPTVSKTTYMDTPDDGSFIQIVSEAASSGVNFLPGSSIDQQVPYPLFSNGDQFIDITIRLKHNYFFPTPCGVTGDPSCSAQPIGVWPKIRARISNNESISYLSVFVFMRRRLNSPNCPFLQDCGNNPREGSPGGPSCWCYTPGPPPFLGSPCVSPYTTNTCPQRAYTPTILSGSVWPMQTLVDNSQEFEQWQHSLTPQANAPGYYQWIDPLINGPGAGNNPKDYVIRRWGPEQDLEDAGTCDLRIIVKTIANSVVPFVLDIDYVEIDNFLNQNAPLASIIENTDEDPKDYGIQKITTYNRKVFSFSFAGTDDITTDATTDDTTTDDFDTYFRTFPTTIISRVRYQEPKPIFIQGFPKFTEGFVVFDKTSQNIQTTRVINGGTYDSI